MRMLEVLVLVPGGWQFERWHFWLHHRMLDTEARKEDFGVWTKCRMPLEIVLCRNGREQYSFGKKL
jgi:hypothetical protein